MDLIRENMETEQWISAKPTQTAAETEVALPGGLREEARVYLPTRRWPSTAAS